MEPIASHPTRTTTPGIRRSLATGALALGLLGVGGTAVVFAASPEPSTSAAPDATTQPSTGAGATDDPTSTKPDCPEGADARGPGPDGGASDGTTDDGGTDDGATLDGTDAESSEPSTAPESTPSTVPSPSVDDSEV